MIAAVFLLRSGGTAQAQVVRFTANLSGDQETPARCSDRRVRYRDRHNGFGDRTVSWSIDVFNMPSGTNNAHFHVGGPGVAGPTVVNIAFPRQISNDFNLSGIGHGGQPERAADQGIRSWDDFIQSLLGGQMYLNVHSNVNSGGEIRGQVIRVP